ncbi:hypothetical protein [Streptomyces lydicus]|uniref:hypothetical protein n=1 Tax=Streptomyces lydicus TaxID=47763 RepID=UPI0037D337F0
MTCSNYVAYLCDPAAGLSLRVTLKRTAAALGDVLRVADSRGGRLPAPDEPDDPDDPDGGEHP